MFGGRVSRIRTATTNPETVVRTPTAMIAEVDPNRSAMAPATPIGAKEIVVSGD